MLGAPFELSGDDTGDGLGIVLVDGFTGTPYEVRYLGERLAQEGFAVHAPLLPGHGGSLEDSIEPPGPSGRGRSSARPTRCVSAASGWR